MWLFNSRVKLIIWIENCKFYIFVYIGTILDYFINFIVLCVEYLVKEVDLDVNKVEVVNLIVNELNNLIIEILS
jgi:hypothetical protein